MHLFHNLVKVFFLPKGCFRCVLSVSRRWKIGFCIVSTSTSYILCHTTFSRCHNALRRQFAFHVACSCSVLQRLSPNPSRLLLTFLAS